MSYRRVTAHRVGQTTQSVQGERSEERNVMSTEEMSPSYARQVGERLRNIRRQQGLSLQAAEAMSSREFKASVLGAYERGERIISVLRLQRLARFYSVPVAHLLPRDVGPMPSSPGRDDEASAPTASGYDDGKVTIDLNRL